MWFLFFFFWPVFWNFALDNRSRFNVHPRFFYLPPFLRAEQTVEESGQPCHQGVSKLLFKPVTLNQLQWRELPGNELDAGGGGTPRKIGWGCAARFPKPLPYL